MRSGMNNKMMASLSLQLAQWNWITRADAWCAWWGTGKLKLKIHTKTHG